MSWANILKDDVKKELKKKKHPFQQIPQEEIEKVNRERELEKEKLRYKQWRKKHGIPVDSGRMYA